MKKFLSLALVSTILLSSFGMVSAFTLETLDVVVNVDDTPETADAVVVDNDTADNSVIDSNNTDNTDNSVNDSNNTDNSVNDSNNTDNTDNSVADSNNSTEDNSVANSNNDSSVTNSNNTDNSVNDSNNSTDNSVVNNYDYSVSNNYNIAGDYYEGDDNSASNNDSNDTGSDDNDSNRVVFYDYRPVVGPSYYEYQPVRSTYYQPSVRPYAYNYEVDFVSGAYVDNKYDPYTPGVSANTTAPKTVTYNYASNNTSGKNVSTTNNQTSSSDSDTGYLGEYSDLDANAPIVEGPTQYWGFPTIDELYENGVSDDRAAKEKRVSKFFETYVDDVLEYEEYFLITFKNPFNGKVIFTFKFTKP